jgi:hypothetical protein
MFVPIYAGCNVAASVAHVSLRQPFLRKNSLKNMEIEVIRGLTPVSAVTGDHRAGLLQRGSIGRTRIVTPTVFCRKIH